MTKVSSGHSRMKKTQKTAVTAVHRDLLYYFGSINCIPAHFGAALDNMFRP